MQIKNKEKAWEFYNEWRKTGSYSPALKAHVRVTRRGWDHIVNGGYTKRSVRDAEVRMQLLPRAKFIIESQTVIYEIRKSKYVTFYGIQYKKVRVVLIRGKSMVIFLSVFRVNKK